MEFMKEEFKMEKDMKIKREKSLIERAFIFSFPLVLMDITKEVSTNTVKPVKSKSPVNQFLHAKDVECIALIQKVKS